jgi:ABC-type transport system involved in cytochrome c biogenesis permease component
MPLESSQSSGVRRRLVTLVLAPLLLLPMLAPVVSGGVASASAVSADVGPEVGSSTRVVFVDEQGAETQGVKVAAGAVSEVGLLIANVGSGVSGVSADP